MTNFHQIWPYCGWLLGLIVFAPAWSVAAEYKEVTLWLDQQADQVTQRVAQLLVDRIEERTQLHVARSKPALSTLRPGLTIWLGIPVDHPTESAEPSPPSDASLREFLAGHAVPPLTDLEPGAEGFLVGWFTQGEQRLLVIAGYDPRGTLYGVGEWLRNAELGPGTVEVPDDLWVRSAPAFAVRGTQVGQSGVSKRLAQVRDWTGAETERVILDYALAGANTFSTDAGPLYDFIKSYGLLTQGGFGANTGTGPPAWQAQESIGRHGYVCLSVPEARAAQIERCDEQFRNGPAFDFVKFHGGDGGGCECDRCKPYGLTFIKTVEEMASRIHAYHPHTKIYFTNQKFDNEDDLAIFRYLQEAPRPWLWAWGYGPGSDATTWQPGHRQTHRLDLFRYPGFGPFDLYPREILRQLPPRHQLVYYNEITHWRYSQHGYIQMYPRADRDGNLPPSVGQEIYRRQPDQALTMVYDRLTFFAWPRYYHRVFQDLLRYGVGDITHSSGIHDHANQWLWQRWLWSPRKSVEESVDEYCRTWFGTAAAPLMAQALFQLEENLAEVPGLPLSAKPGIDRYYQGVHQAGASMPSALRANSWLWRAHCEKAALDKYTQLNVRQQEAWLRNAEAQISQAIPRGSAEIDATLTELLRSVDQIRETTEMERLRKEAEQMGNESNQLFGWRNEGFYNLEHDFVGLGWLKRHMQRAQNAKGPEQAKLLHQIIAYEDPGPGGFYDNLGQYPASPRVIRGYPYDHGQPYERGSLWEANRPSQRSMHYTQDESEGVALRYDHLDSQATYRVRMTLVRPWYAERYAHRMPQTSQAIYADEHCLAEVQVLPERMSDFFSYDIPAAATADGTFVLHLRKAAGVADGDRVEREQWRNCGGWGTLVSEVWLERQP